jgi:hypothetical protein
MKDLSIKRKSHVPIIQGDWLARGIGGGYLCEELEGFGSMLDVVVERGVE